MKRLLAAVLLSIALVAPTASAETEDNSQWNTWIEYVESLPTDAHKGMAWAWVAGHDFMNWVAWSQPDAYIWESIGKCETGMNYQHHTTTYQGAFGFAYTTWDQYSPDVPGWPDEAYNAEPWQQLYVARELWRRYGNRPWGCKV